MFWPHCRSMIRVILLASVVSACVEGSALSPPTVSDQSDLGGDGLPVQHENQPIPHQSEPLEGTLGLRPNGCWTVASDPGELLVIFPAGFHKPPEDGSAMRAPDGVSFTDGTRVEGLGAVVPVELHPGVPDGFFGGYLAFCDSEAQRVAVFDSLRPVADPTDEMAAG